MLDGERLGFGQLVIDCERFPFVEQVFGRHVVVLADRRGFRQQRRVARNVCAKVLR